MTTVPFNILQGKTLTSFTAVPDTDVVNIETTGGFKFQLLHQQDCCETVTLDEVIGDVNDLIGTPILLAEERDGDLPAKGTYDESYTWTFYELRTIKGSVTLRWYGESNGYYSESVDLVLIKKPD